MSIAENIRNIRANIADAAVRSGRNPEDVILVAAAKMNGADSVREAVAGGVDAVGENRVQELLEKNAQGAYRGTKLHFIGTLQKNKVRHLVGLCDLIQSVDSADLCELIGTRARALNLVQEILIEVNIGREPAKSGVLPEQLDPVLETAAQTAGIFVRGLMAIPPISFEPGGNREYFEEMYKLFVDIRAKKYDNVSMQYLSMGMSGDYEDAISAGANMVRVGSLIFGHRRY